MKNLKKKKKKKKKSATTCVNHRVTHINVQPLAPPPHTPHKSIDTGRRSSASLPGPPSPSSTCRASSSGVRPIDVIWRVWVLCGCICSSRGDGVWRDACVIFRPCSPHVDARVRIGMHRPVSLITPHTHTHTYIHTQGRTSCWRCTRAGSCSRPSKSPPPPKPPNPTQPNPNTITKPPKPTTKTLNPKPKCRTQSGARKGWLGRLLNSTQPKTTISAAGGRGGWQGVATGPSCLLMGLWLVGRPDEMYDNLFFFNLVACKIPNQREGKQTERPRK